MKVSRIILNEKELDALLIALEEEKRTRKNPDSEYLKHITSAETKITAALLEG